MEIEVRFIDVDTMSSGKIILPNYESLGLWTSNNYQHTEIIEIIISEE